MVAALLRDDPEFEALPADVPAGLRRLLGRCLEKDPKQRIRDIGDVRFELDAAVSGDDVVSGAGGGSAPSGSGRERIAWALAALGLGAAGVLATMLLGGVSNTPAGVIQAQLPFTGAMGQYGTRQTSLAISPDGRSIAFVGVADGVSQLYVRSLEADEAVPIRGTEGGGRPFFSPDGQSVGFSADGQIKKVALNGGAPEDVGPADDPRGAVWGDDGFIVFTPSVNEGLWRLSEAGGTPERLTSLDLVALERTHRFPDVLPGGRGVLFTIGTTDMSSYDDAKIAVLPAGAETATVIIDRGTMPRYSTSGHIVYYRGGELLAVEFDIDRLEVIGTPVSLVSNVGFKAVYGIADFAVSASTLVYLAGGETQPTHRLLAANRAGETTDLSERAEHFFQGRLSADGQRLLTVIEAANDTLWLVDLRRDNLSRLTFRGNINSFAWSADGTHAIYSVGNEIRSVATDGSGVDTLLYAGDWTVSDLDVATDGSRIVFDVSTVSSIDLWMLSLADNTASPWLETTFNEGVPRFSPDGVTVAYISTETGRPEVFLRSDSGEKVRVSDNGGDTPTWSSGGSELVYTEDDRLVAVSVLAGSRLDVGTARTLFTLPPRSALGDITPDGQRFVLVQEGAPFEPPAISLIHGWVELLAGR
jgi:serine/threonine-protein kinase